MLSTASRLLTRPRSWWTNRRPAASLASPCPSWSGSPPTSADPSSGTWNPARIFIRVDLPEPFSPTSARISPGSNDRLTLSRTRGPAKLFDMLVTVSAAVMLPPATCGGECHSWRGIERGLFYVELRLRRAARPDPTSNQYGLTASDTKLLPAYGQVNGVRVLLPKRSEIGRA